MKLNKKFILMGTAALLGSYAIQAVGVIAINEASNTSHEMKMVSLYNSIWTQIDKKDVLQKIKEYQTLDKNPPLGYNFGLLPQKREKSLFLRPKNLPDAENVVQVSQQLSKKTKLFN